MIPLTAKAKVVLKVAGICAAVIVAWLVVDPLSHLVLLLDVEKEVDVAVNTSVPISAKIKKDIEIQLPQDFNASVLINGPLAIPLDETLEVPLKLTVTAPVEADVWIDQVLDLNVDVPIDIVLTQEELKLDRLLIPIDTEVFIDDTLEVETTLPLDTTVKSVMGASIPVKATIPVKMSVPVKQKVRIKDEVTVAVKELHAPLKMVLPIRGQVPFKQMIHIAGTVRVPIDQSLSIRVKKVVNATVSDPIPVSIAMGQKLPISLEATVDTDVKIVGTVPIQLGTLSIQKKSVRVKVK